jgi:DeoR family glycerol-3-phosphate regulon repressor
MSQSFRHPEILALARRTGRVTVEALAQHFGVTHQTIRRDLAVLAESGRLDRVHGGAVPPSGTVNIAYEERRALNTAAKAAIARACAARIPEDITLFLSIGTTTEAVARALADHAQLMVVTNNLNVANILATQPGCSVTLTGGSLRHADGGLVGPLAADTLDAFKFDLAVIGCSALDAEGDLLDYDIHEVAVSKALLKQSRCAILVADQSKLQRNAPLRIASLAQLDAVITDAPLPAPLAKACAAWETEVIVAPAA